MSSRHSPCGTGTRIADFRGGANRFARYPRRCAATTNRIPATGEILKEPAVFQTALAVKMADLALLNASYTFENLSPQYNSLQSSDSMWDFPFSFSLSFSLSS
jgi:hypothetical protein